MDFDYFNLRNCFFVFALLVAVKKIPFLNYYFKFGLYIFHVSLLSTVLIPVFLFKPKDVMNIHIAAKVMKYSAQLTGLTYKFDNLQKLNVDKTMVVVANHQSMIDIIGMFNMWYSFGKLSVITKKEVLYSGPFGISAWLAGLIFINRSKRSKAAQQINEALMEMKTKNVKLWAFPEGTRRTTDQIHEFKKGAFMAAIYAQVPIIPVVYSSYMSFLDSKNKIFKDAEIKVSVLDEISTEGLTVDDVDDLIKKTHQVMSIKYKEISNFNS